MTGRRSQAGSRRATAGTGLREAVAVGLWPVAFMLFNEPRTEPAPMRTDARSSGRADMTPGRECSFAPPVPAEPSSPSRSPGRRLSDRL